MQYNKFTSSDFAHIGHLQPVGWPDITGAFRFYTDSDFCHPVKVSVDNKIIGIGCSIVFDTTAWLAHIIVDEKFRNQGVGSAITECLLDVNRSKGIGTILLIATPLGEPVYLKAGFRTVSEYHYFKREAPPAGKKQSPKVQPYTKDLYPEIIKLDALVTGEQRVNLLHPYLDQSFVFIDGGTVCGFYIPDLEEGPICAKTIEAGRTLMKFKYSRVEKAAIAAENLAGINCLHELGFVRMETKGKRMILGKDIAWKPEMIYSRTGGNFG